ncbi:unnamed protein product [Hyaloperonospora brassicae]|uniref:C2H2-type domain-containing protein n=1 Tax=Hyaloperonospora brassicae TaxID=162125 RepID=A0AAV0V0C9_HYABA|nr:unnamed protein product [Hyaloperonospora brassicae]
MAASTSTDVLLSSDLALPRPKRRRLERESTTAATLCARHPLCPNGASVNAQTATEDRRFDSSSSDRSERHHKSTPYVNCSDAISSASEQDAHCRPTRRRQSFGCEHEGCSKRYAKREHLTRHVETVHVRGATQALEVRKPFKCDLCQARFTYNHGLTRHVKRSHWNVNRPFECAECRKGFKKKSELQAHSYVHTGVLPFECKECGERFMKRFQMTRHQRKHSVNKSADTEVYVCDCGELCFDEQELKDHRQAEHGQETGAEAHGEAMEQEACRHVCLVCDQTFSRKQSLRAHLRTHFESLDDRKLYTCPVDGCEKAYTRPSNLMTHYNAVHDEHKSKRFACPREGCTARFGYKTVLAHHIESIHDNPKPPKRSERQSAGILERALGVNQVGDQVLQAAAGRAEEETLVTDL